MKFVSTFEITKGFDRWLHLVDVELKEKLEKYGVKVHFACANDDETRVYDMSEIDDPSLVEAFMADEEVIKLRTEAGVNLSSNSNMTNYLLLNIKQQLLKAKAQSVRIAYPKTTFRLAETATADGVADELDTVLMTVRDQELTQNSVDRDKTRQLLLRVREAGVDTEDRSVYSQNFYMRVALLSGLFVFLVGAGLYLILERYWPGHGRRAGVAVAGLSVGVGLIVFTENMGQRSGVSEEMATNLSGMFMEDVEKSSVSDIGSLTNQLEKALKESRDDLDEDFEISEEEKKRMEEEADDGW